MAKGDIVMKIKDPDGIVEKIQNAFNAQCTRLDDIEHVLAMIYASFDDSDISAPLKRIRARLEARQEEAGE